MDIGLVTCHVLPEPDPDAKPLADALRARGHTPIDVPWDDPWLPPAGFDLFVIRSAWNYFEDPDGFMDWSYRVSQSTPMINPSEAVIWNIHKCYLCQLARAGIRVVNTVLLNFDLFVSPARKDATAVAKAKSAIAEFGDVVIKPAISARSVGARRFDKYEAEQAFEYAFALEGLGSDAIIQPYIDGFRDPGERSLIWINGKWTHAVRKHPRFSGQHERVERDEPPTDAELAVAQAAIEQVPYPIHYARADLVMSESGQPLLSELELIEPSLFFDHSAEALERFVAMIESQGRRR